MSSAVYLKGRFGTYRVATVAEVDRRLTLLAGLLGTATPTGARRIRHDLDLLLDRRNQLALERGTTKPRGAP